MKPQMQIILNKRYGEWTWTLARVGFKGHPTRKPLESSRVFADRAEALTDAKKLCDGLGYSYSPNAKEEASPLLTSQD
jgi:hypothetical protein